MILYQRVITSIKITGTRLYTLFGRDIVRVKCLVQEHNTQCPRPGLEPARSGDEYNNHEASGPPTFFRRMVAFLYHKIWKPLESFAIPLKLDWTIYGHFYGPFVKYRMLTFFLSLYLCSSMDTSKRLRTMSNEKMHNIENRVFQLQRMADSRGSLQSSRTTLKDFGVSAQM